MMPSTTYATPGKFAKPPTGDGDGVTFGDGLNPYYGIDITEHDNDACITARFGCMEEGAENYDQYANVQTRCWHKKGGCLDPDAINFMCSNNDKKSPCTGQPGYLPDDNVTTHEVRACLYPWNFSPAPPAPPSPAFPSDVDINSARVVIQFTNTLKMEFSGEVAEYTPKRLCTMAQGIFRVTKQASLATTNNNDGTTTAVDGTMETVGGGGDCCCTEYLPNPRTTVPEQIPSELEDERAKCNLVNDKWVAGESLPKCPAGRVSAGSVVHESISIFEDKDAADAERAQIVAAIGDSATSAQAVLGDALGVTVLRSPVVDTTEVLTIKPEGGLGPGGAAAIVAACIVVILIMIGVYYKMKKKKAEKKTVYPA